MNNIENKIIRDKDEGKITREQYNIINPLINTEYERLNWENTELRYPGLVRIRTIGDGSCFFHAIAKAYFIPYKIGMIDGIAIDRREFIRELRKDLSIKLGEEIDNGGKRYYDILSRGKLGEIGKEMKEYTLENMQKELNSSLPVDNVYNEFISNILNKDIYILDYITKDVYITGDDDDILYKDRDSIVILYIPGHYELIGEEKNEGILTLFKPENELIKRIRERINIKKKGGKYK